MQHHSNDALLGQAVARMAKSRAARFRLFSITYDNTKVKTKNPNMVQQFRRKLTLYGVVWPPTDFNPNSGVSLSNGIHFGHGMDELYEYFGKAGKYELLWLDEEEA